MGKSAIVLLALLVAALALSLPACGTDDESRAPATTVHNDPVQTNEDRAEEEVGEEEGEEPGSRQESWQRPGLNETVRARGTRAPTGSGRATPTGCGLRLAASPPAPIGLSHGACRPDNARDSDAAPHPAPASPVQGRTRAPSCPITGPSAIQQSVPIATTRNALGALTGRDGRGTCGPRLGLAGWCYCWRSGRAPSAFPVPPPLISPGARGARGLCSRHSGEGERRCPSPSSALRATNPSSER